MTILWYQSYARWCYLSSLALRPGGSLNALVWAWPLARKGSAHLDVIGPLCKMHVQPTRQFL